MAEVLTCAWCGVGISAKDPSFKIDGKTVCRPCRAMREAETSRPNTTAQAPEYGALKFLGSLCRIGGWLVLVLGIGLGIMSGAKGDAAGGLGLIVGGLMGGVVYIAIGEGLHAFRDLVINSWKKS